MVSSDDWIAPMVEHCLKVYRKEIKDPKVNYWGNQSNLRFSDGVVRLAVVDSVASDEEVPTWNITDARTQVKAMLPRVSLNHYEENHPDRPLNIYAAKGYVLELTEFELVFEYSKEKPEVHLYLKRFNIDWERGRLKSARIGKKIPNIPHVHKLMREVYAKKKGRAVRGPQEEPDTARSECGYESSHSIASQNERNSPRYDSYLVPSGVGVSQEMFASQAPNPNSKLKLVPVGGNGASTFSKQLLKVLQPQSKGTDVHNPLNHVLQESPNPLASSAAETTGQEPTQGPAQDGVLPGTISRAASPASGAVHNFRETSVDINGKQPAEVEPEQLRPAAHAVEPIRQSTEHADVNLPVPQFSVKDTEVKRLTTHSRPNRSDPWAGMTKIRKGDIRIPKDQLELIENKRQWVPPATGESTQIHVPPGLLIEWNRIALQKSHLEKERHQKDTRPESMNHRESFPPEATNPAPSTRLSSEEYMSWSPSQSPEPKTLPRSRLRLPADSSPVPHRQDGERVGSPHKRKQDAQVAELPEDTDTGTNEDETRDPHHTSKSPKATEIEKVPVQNHGQPAYKAPKNHGIALADSNQTLEPVSRHSIPEPKPAGTQGHADVETAVQNTDETNEPNNGELPPERDDVAPTQSHKSAEPATAGLDQNDAPENGDPVSRQETEARIKELDTVSDSGSDDSVMDTSVPCPLGRSSQPVQSTSQPEQEITSSGPSLPGVTTHERLQVVETPAADLDRLRFERELKDNPGSESRAVQLQSSAPAKSSSQSRIFNTYEDVQHVSIEDEDSGSVAVDIMGTQLSGGNLSLAGITPHSQLGAVIDSSGPRSRERSVRAEGSSDPFSSYREMIPSQSFQSSQPDEESAGPPISTPGQPNRPDKGDSVRTGVNQSAQNTPDRSDTNGFRMPSMKRSRSETEGDVQAPSKRHRAEQHDDIRRNETDNPGPNVVSRRQSYLGDAARRAGAQSIYEKFRGAYRTYTGNFAHFVKLCWRLRTLRSKGILQRSFLWDDFIIMHSVEYPQYMEECLALEAKPLVYEDYFTTYFSRPSYKKRILTPNEIEASAGQYDSQGAPRVTASPSAARSDVNASFTASLVNKLSNFHAHSFSAEPQSSRPSHDDEHMIPCSPTPPVKVEIKRLSASPASSRDASSSWSSPERKPVVVEELEIQATPEQSPEPSHPDSIHHKSTRPHVSEPTGDDDEDQDQEMEDTTHETASVELGDEEDQPTTTNQHDAPSNAEEESETDSDENENWFDSLRQIHPTKPVWSDDPNTPFKVWARADQNLLVDRRRRGGAAIQVDEKGTVQRRLTAADAEFARGNSFACGFWRPKPA